MVVDKATHSLTQMTIADKTVMTVPVPTGTVEHPVDEPQRQAQVLATPDAIALAELGVRIEEYFGTPQDIEWCIVKRTFHIVQARPITTLPQQTIDWRSPIDGAKWLKDLQAGEWATEPLSPLGATTTFSSMISARQRKLPMQRFPWYSLVNGWLYLRADFRLLWLFVAPCGVLWPAFSGRMDGHRRMRRRWPGHLTGLSALETANLRGFSDEELRAHIDRSLEDLGWWWWEVTLYAAVPLMGEQILARLDVPGLTDAAILFRGNDSLLLDAERALRAALRTGNTTAYLERFGHLVESADPIHPTLRESPGLLTQHLAAAGTGSLSPDERLQRVRHQRVGAEEAVSSMSGIRGLAARRILALAQGYAAHTDDAVFHFQRVLAILRSALLESGRRLSVARVLERADDVFYLEYPELWRHRGTDLTQLAATRRALRDRQKRLVPPAFIPPAGDPAWKHDSQMRLFSSVVGRDVMRRGLEERNGRRILIGTPGSPGRARGTARVITGPDDFHRFEAGDVLVAHATTPIWTPLLNIASAAITEVGGPFSHTAIVAREFGIPLVNGALDATHVVPDGSVITVDGSAGVVEL